MAIAFFFVSILMPSQPSLTIRCQEMGILFQMRNIQLLTHFIKRTGDIMKRNISACRREGQFPKDQLLVIDV